MEFIEHLGNNSICFHLAFHFQGLFYWSIVDYNAVLISAVQQSDSVYIYIYEYIMCNSITYTYIYTYIHTHIHTHTHILFFFPFFQRQQSSSVIFSAVNNDRTNYVDPDPTAAAEAQDEARSDCCRKQCPREGHLNLACVP